MAVPLKRAGLASAALAVVGGIAWYAYHDRHGRYFQDTNDATIQADQVAISSKLAGYVRTVAVGDNQAVKRGTLLVEIDPTDYETKLSAADAEIASARAAENASKASRAEALAGVAAARASLQSARADLAFAARETARYRPL